MSTIALHLPTGKPVLEVRHYFTDGTGVLRVVASVDGLVQVVDTRDIEVCPR